MSDTSKRLSVIPPIAVAAIAVADAALTFLWPHAMPASDFRVGMVLPFALAIVWLFTQISRRGRSHLLRISYLWVAPIVVIVGATMCARGTVALGTFHWLMGLGFALGACRPAGGWRLRRVAWVPWAMLGLGVLALALRHVGLLGMPGGIWIDEAEHFKNLFENPTGQRANPFDLTSHIHEGWTYTSNLYLYAVSMMMHWLGISFHSMKLVSTLPSALAVPGVFLVGHALRRPRMGLLAALLVATAHWHLLPGRWGHYHVLCATLQIWAMAFVVRGLGRPRDDRSWMVAGILLGLCFYSYLLAPAALLIALASLATLWVIRSRLRARIMRGSALLVFGVLLTAGPLFATLIRDPEKIGRRVVDVSIMATVREQGFGPLARNAVDTVEMLLWRGDSNPRHNIAPPESEWWTEDQRPPAMVNPLWAVVLWMSIGMALWRWRQPLPALLLVWLGVGLLPSILCSPEESPSSYRALLAIPAVALLTAWGVERLMRPRARWVLIAAICAMNLWLIFGVHWRNPASIHSIWGGVDTRLAVALGQRGSFEDRSETGVYVDAALDIDLIRLLLTNAGYASVEAVSLSEEEWPTLGSSSRLLWAGPRHALVLANRLGDTPADIHRDRFGLIEVGFIEPDLLTPTPDGNSLRLTPLDPLRGWQWRFVAPDGQSIETVGDWSELATHPDAQRIEAEGLWWRDAAEARELIVGSRHPYEISLEVRSLMGNAQWTWESDEHGQRLDHHPGVFYPQSGLNRLRFSFDPSQEAGTPQFAIHWTTAGDRPRIDMATERGVFHSPPGDDLWAFDPETLSPGRTPE